MTLPITDIINVSISSAPMGLTAPNVNSVALFTTETPSNINPYGIYISANSIGSDYGTGSTTYAMANAIFAQNPNILSGNGRLVVIPLQSAVSAKSGYFTTTDLTNNLSSILAVTDGNLKVNLNGTVINLQNINFNNCQTLADVATILQSLLVDAIVTSNATQIIVTSKKVGSTASVTLGQVSGGSGVDLSATGYFHTAIGIATSGTESSGENIVGAIARIGDSVQYTGVITNLEMSDTVIETLAAAIQAQDLIFVHHFSSTTDIAGVITTISSATETKFRSLLYTTSLTDANLMKSAYVGRAFSVNFTASATSQTLQLKTLATISPDPGITQTIYSNCLTAGADIYPSIAGRASVISSGGNDYFDNIYNKLWLKGAIEVAGFNFLAQTNTKVPQNEIGMTGLKNAYALVCGQAILNGVATAGQTWTSSETFGNPADLIRNISDVGYYIYSLPVAQQNPTDRANRVAPLVQIAIQFSGAIHTSSVAVFVEY